MPHRVLLVALAALLSVACAGRTPAPPPPAPEPVVVTEQPTPEPAVEPPPPAPAKPEQGNGRWRVSVASERTAELTTPWVQRLEGAGYKVTVETAEVDGTTWHRVVLPGYSLDGAHAMLPILEQEGMAKAWIIPRTAQTAAVAAPAAETAPAPEPAPAPKGEIDPATGEPPAN